MSRRQAFVLGWVLSSLATRTAYKIARSNTVFAAKVRREIYSREKTEYLLRTEVEVGEEINRRVRAREFA